MAYVDDTYISLRFKHGLHTIFLLVDPFAPIYQITYELVELLRDRYPKGLRTCLAPFKETMIKRDTRLAYAVLNVPSDPSQGWRRLDIGVDDDFTVTKCGLKNKSVVAFNVCESPDDEVVFHVEWPRDDEEQYEQGG